MTIVVSEGACDRGASPVLVRLVEFGGTDPLILERSAELFQRFSVSGRQIDEGGMVVRRSTELQGIFESSVSCLNGLLRERDVSARDGVEVVLLDLRLVHDVLQ